MNNDITTYNEDQDDSNQAICEFLEQEICKGLPKADSKVWHGAPVWFIDGNPVAGYAVRKHNVQLLFWSGQSFNEPKLQNEGRFKAAEARYTAIDQIDTEDLARWLQKSQTIQWDYKNIVKRKGKLLRLQTDS